MSAEHAPALGPSAQVGRLRLRPPVRVAPDLSVQHAASKMRHEVISSLVVDTQPPSFVTERDIVSAVAAGRAPSDRVATIATRAPVWIPATVTVSHAAALMVGLGVRHLLILGLGGEIVGVLSIRDAIEVLLPALDPDGWLSAFDSALADVR